MSPEDAFYQDPNGERRKTPVLTDEQIDAIAARAAVKVADQMEHLVDRIADKAVEKITAQAYQLVGKTVIDRMFMLVGILAIGLTAWAAGRGWIKGP